MYRNLTPLRQSRLGFTLLPSLDPTDTIDKRLLASTSSTLLDEDSEEESELFNLQTLQRQRNSTS
jgi:hypothetical protein